MNDQDGQTQGYGTKADKSALTRWILWGGMFFSHLIIASLAVYFRATTGGDGPAEPLEIQIVLGAAGLGCLVPVLLAPRLFSAMDRTTLALVRWSLAESVTIFALVLGVMGARWEILAVLITAGLLTHVLLRPGR